MKLLIFYLLFYLLPNGVNNNSIIKVIQKIHIDDNTIVLNSNYSFAFEGDNLFYCNNSLDRDCSIEINSVSDTLKYHLQFKKEIFNYPNRCKSYPVHWALKPDNVLYLYVNEHLFEYQFDNDSLLLIKEISLKKIFNSEISFTSDRIKLIGKRIVGMRYVFQPVRPVQDGFYYWWVNLEDTSDYGFSNFQYPKDYYWTVAIPRDGFDINEKGYFVSRFTDYKITFYNFDGEPVDSIRRDEPKWNKFESIPDSTVLTSHPVNVFNFLKREGDEKFLIHRTNFIGDDKILVCYSHGKAEDKMYNEYYDIWEKENGKWNLKVKDLNFNETQVSDNPYENKPFGRNYRICGDKIISFHLDFESDSGSYVLIRKF